MRTCVSAVSSAVLASFLFVYLSIYLNADDHAGSSRGAHNYPSPNAALTRTQAAANLCMPKALPPIGLPLPPSSAWRVILGLQCGHLSLEGLSYINIARPSLCLARSRSRGGGSPRRCRCRPPPSPAGCRFSESSCWFIAPLAVLEFVPFVYDLHKRGDLDAL